MYRVLLVGMKVAFLFNMIFVYNISAMALVTLTDLTAKENNLDILKGNTGSLLNLITELQGLSVDVVTGAASSTSIAVSGMVTTDTLLSVLEFTISGGNVTGLNDRTGVTTIHSAGNIRVAANTTDSRIVVLWHDKV